VRSDASVSDLLRLFAVAKSGCSASLELRRSNGIRLNYMWIARLFGAGTLTFRPNSENVSESTDKLPRD
jgi:hypothetical protein